MLGYLTDIVFLSGGMFHWTTRQSDKYSLDPTSGKPIWVDDAGNFLVNWVTIYVMDSMEKFQNMQSLKVKSSESIHDRMLECYPAVKTEGRAYLPSVPVISKPSGRLPNGGIPYKNGDIPILAKQGDILYTKMRISHKVKSMGISPFRDIPIGDIPCS